MRKLTLQLLLGITLVARSGIVEVQRNNIWSQITPGETVNMGERVRTGAGSSAAIEIGPGTVVTLSDSTEVEVRDSGGSPVVQLEKGNMKVFSATDIQVAAKETTLESVGRPVDMQVGVESDRLNVMVFSGAVRKGKMTIHGTQDPNVRTYTANGQSRHPYGYSNVYPTYNIYPWVMYGNPNPGDGRIVPPAVSNPTNPGYRPTQSVPPMSDPIRVPLSPP